MTRWDLCNAHLAQHRPSWFLEIGAAGEAEGRGGRFIRADMKIGVDVREGRWQCAYDLTDTRGSDTFFLDLPAIDCIDTVLIDGLHHADQVLRDVDHALEILEPDGLIVVHDCNPQSEAAQQVPRPAGKMRWNGDVWKAIVVLRATRPDLQVVTMNTDEGLGLICRTDAVNPVNRLASIVFPDALTWDGLVAHRLEWLGLIDATDVVWH